MIRNKTLLKAISVFVLLSVLNTVLMPTTLLALTSGPNSPEFSSFEPVATTDMVDVFSGDFTYNLPVVSIPGPDGGGYSMSLSYHSGVSPEEESSWVGYGWTLNPGVINRSKNGLPDDYKGAEVVQYAKTAPNWTSSVNQSLNLEFTSNDNIPMIGYNKSIRFNNYRGFASSTGFSLNYKGMAGLNFTRSGGETTVDLSISPYQLVSAIVKKVKKKQDNEPKEKEDKEGAIKKLKKYLKDKNADKHKPEYRGGSKAAMAKKVKGSMFSVSSMGSNSFPTSVSAFQGIGYNYSASLQVSIYNSLGIQGGAGGNFNIQVPYPKTDMKAFGYMNNPNRNMYDNSTYQNADRNDNSTILSDYAVEKGSDFDKRDYYLGVPHQGADMFVASGEALSGGFRLYHGKTGTYYPGFVKNKQKIKQMGIEFGVGGSFQIGLDVGVGNTKTTVGDWDFPDGVLSSFNICALDIEAINSINSPLLESWGVPVTLINQGIEAVKEYLYILKANRPCGNQFDTADKGFFRFNNDMGGMVDYTGNTDVVSAEIPHSAVSIIPGTRSFSPRIGSVGLKELPAVTGRSSYIGYHLVKDIKASGSDRFEKSSQITDYSLVGDAPDNGIGEFEIFNAEGLRYVYALPAYSKNEKSMRVNVKNTAVVENRHVAYQETFTGADVLKNRVVTGECSPEPYAVSHLLTQITTPDYVDIGNDGPDTKDFGGWTKFGYRKWKDSNNNEWYHYRTPYNGMTYNQGTMVDKNDDVGMISSGDKQLYYLKAVETKTHVAFFVTNKTVASDFAEYSVGSNAVSNLNGSGTSRNDAYGAVRETVASPFKDPAAAAKVQDASQKSEFLERIVVYAKGRFDKPLQTVYFEFDNSLCRKLPNANNNYTSSGKLTLKRIWFESEGVVNARIAPYEFHYDYQAAYSSEIVTRYPEIANFANGLDNAAQNPDYKPYALDAWGNYRKNGDYWNSIMFPWKYQGDEAGTYDPAAWNLKRIKLPSGGEIHIQYEEKDYRYVQDKNAMVMASLSDNSSDGDVSTSTAFYLNLKSMGLDPANPANTSKIAELYENLKTYYAPSDKGKKAGERIYFRFLYALEGESSPDFSNCKSEYITGYVSVRSVELSGNNIYLRLGDDPDWEKSDKHAVPKRICYDHLVANAHGKMEGNSCDSKFDGLQGVEDKIMTYYEHQVEDNDEYITSNNKYLYGDEKRFKAAVVRPAIFETVSHAYMGSPKKNQSCKKINYGLSYLKIPLFVKAKKGGGIRVKRVMMYDKGIESGDANIYGSEYLYQEADGMSSGVATNEPGAGREENALVGFQPKKNQTWLGKTISGRDKEQVEGPVGEDLLPSPSVSHSRVVVKNIHNGHTGTGYQVHEFVTVKDYPFTEEHTEIKDNRRRDWMNIPAGIFNFKVDKWWLAQGYKFTINSMHGKSKRTATYAGKYGGPSPSVVSETLYEYYEPGEVVKMLKYDPEANQFSYYNYVPGYEQDITMEQRSVHDRTMDLSLEMDITVSFENVWPLITFSACPSFSFQESAVSTHVTSKVLRYPTIIKKVTNRVDGGEVVTENLAFNSETGDPVLVRASDGFDNLLLGANATKHNGGKFSWSIPASWIYPELGQKAKNANSTNQLSAMVGNIVSYGEEGDWLKNNFTQNVSSHDPQLSNSLIGVFKELLFGSKVKVWDLNTIQPSGVLSATASQLNKNWHVTTDAQDIVDSYNDQLTVAELQKLNNNWRLQASYAYNTDIRSANRPITASTNRIYNGGTYTGNFSMFDWTQGVGNQGSWLMANQVTKYDPNGNAVEEKNILDIPSAAKFGYGKMLPIAVAQNANYESFFFQHYEEESSFPDFPSHSGKKSLNYRANQNYELIGLTDNVKLTAQLKNKGAVIKLWLKSSKPGQGTFENTSTNFRAKINNNVIVPFNKVASTGEWSLYSAKVENWSSLSINSKLTLKLLYDLLPGEEVFIDDFRFQPLDAQVNCNVYDDKSFKPVTQFDDQHFGVFYQYNDAGQLVRQMIETERGMRTLQETQFNIPKVNRIQ